MANLSIDNKLACKILKKAFKILSKHYDVEITLAQYSNGSVCILSEDKEIAVVTNSSNKHDLFFSSGIELLETLMDDKVKFLFHPFKFSDDCIINFSKMFGSTIEEVKINLELNDV